MELLVSVKLAHSKFHGIPWNSMELLVSAKLAHSKFHGIPWNCSCQRNWRTASSMEFHGTARVSEIGAFSVPWNSMEFHGTARVSEIGALIVPWNSMEFHGTARVSEIGALEGPWNSMELLVSVPWNSVEPIVCHLMEPLVSSIHWVLKWYRIPWNLSFKILMKVIFDCAGWINFHKLIIILYLFASLFHQLIFLLSIFALYLICISGITHHVTKYHSTSLFNAHWNLFGQKVPWNFLQSSIELFGQHLNNTCGSMEFHGIPWNFVQIQSSMEFHGTFSILPSSMEFTNLCFIINICIIPYMHFRHYSSRNKISFNISFQCSFKLIWSKSSMELSPEFHWTFWTTFEQHHWFHGIPWNSMEFCPDPKFHGIPWNFIHTPEFHGIPWNSILISPPISSMEFHGTFW